MLRENDLENLCQNYIEERSKYDTEYKFSWKRSDYENTYSVEDTIEQKNPLTRINKGLKIVIRTIKSFVRNFVQSIKNYVAVTFGGCFDGTSLFTPKCWILPTTFLASGLLARDEICSLVGNNFVGKISLNMIIVSILVVNLFTSLNIKY